MTVVDPVQARVGTTLCGKWTLERLLGEGGMAAVYLAVHSIGRREAVKVLHREIAGHPEVSARFEQEAHAVNRLQHPGVVAIHDIDVTEDGAPFMVMEYLEGESLAERLGREERIAEPDLLRIVDELLDVLAAAHGIGIIHRDIKPDNLFLLRSGRLKVLDFGVARLRDGSPTGVKTRMGAMLGTPNYMAPEQIRGVDIDPRVDLFAVGAVMFELTAGRDVHDASSDQELLAKMLTVPAPPLATAAPHARPELCRIVDRALAFDRDNRYPDARSMQADVRALREGKAPAIPAPQPAAPTRVDVPAPPAAPPSAPTMVSAPPVAVPSMVTPPPAVVQPAAIPPATSKPLRERIAIIAAAVALVVIVLFLLLSSSNDEPEPNESFKQEQERRWQEEQNYREQERVQEQAPPKHGRKKRKKDD